MLSFLNDPVVYLLGGFVCQGQPCVDDLERVAILPFHGGFTT